MILLALAIYQAFLRLVFRYVLPTSPARFGDELAWLELVQRYGSSGLLPAEALVQGPGIFWIVRAGSALLGVGYRDSLIALSTLLGIVYVFPVYILFRKLSGDRGEVAILATLLVSTSDVMLYSMTVARPQLFGLFLVPIALLFFYELHSKPSQKLLAGFLSVSTLLLLFHAPISYTILLITVSSLSVILRGKSPLSAVSIYALYAFYALALAMTPAGLGRIWNQELMTVHPLSLISSTLGSHFYLALILVPFFICAVSIATHHFYPSLSRFTRTRIQRTSLVGLASIALVLTSIPLLHEFNSKYEGYIVSVYGSWNQFAALHSYKLVVGALCIYGMKSMWGELRRGDLTRFRFLMCWLFTLLGIAVALLPSMTLKLPPGLWNLDERVLEFAYYPAFGFASHGYVTLIGRFSSRRYRVALHVMFSLLTVPALVLGMRDPDFLIAKE